MPAVRASLERYLGRLSNMAEIVTNAGSSAAPWEAARARFLDGLPDDQKTLFENATVENIFYTSSVAFSQAERSSKTRKVQKKLQPFIAVVEDYGKAMDVLTNSASLYLSPIWGSMRVVLQVRLCLSVSTLVTHTLTLHRSACAVLRQILRQAATDVRAHWRCPSSLQRC